MDKRAHGKIYTQKTAHMKKCTCSWKKAHIEESAHEKNIHGKMRT